MPSLKAMAREAQKSSKSVVPKGSAKRKPAASIFKSTERVSDSDLESETESEPSSDSGEESPNPAPPVEKVYGQKLKSASSIAKVISQRVKLTSASSDDEIEEEKESDSKYGASSKSGSGSSSSSDGEESEDESDSHNDSGSESGNDSVVETQSEQHKASITAQDIFR